MSSINSDYSYTSMLYSSQNSKYRGGVTGWNHKDSETYSSTSATYSSSKLSDKSSAYVKSVKEYSNKINDAIDLLTGKDTEKSLDSAKATSSDEAVSVKITDQEKAAAFKASGGTKTLEVVQLAKAQKNSGEMLNAQAINSVGEGSKSFTIGKDGQEYKFSVDINATDSNRTVQEKMAASINRQNTGISATVVYNKNDKTSSLVLSSKDTGKEQAFTIEDVGSGNLVSEMGADYVSTTAQDAIYTQDGATRNSSKNEVNLGDGISAELKNVTDKEVTVKAETDSTDMSNAVFDLVNGFNQLREVAIDNVSDNGAKSLLDKLDSVTSAYSATLKRAGISFNTDGYLQIDKDAMQKAIENGQAESVFNKDSGFTRSLSNISERAESDPTRFLSAQARSGKETSSEASEIDYNDYLNDISFSPYQSSQLDHWDSIGMLFSAMA